MDLAEHILDLGRRARTAARALAGLTTAEKNEALRAMADALEAQRAAILSANSEDVARAEAQNLASALIDRLRLDDARLAAMAQAIRTAAALPDPVGEIIREWTRPNGLRICKQRVPLGVVGMIYESRPNVTSDAAALCLKTGNAVILRGGSEAAASNAAIVAALQAAAPNDSIQLVAGTDRAAVRLLAEMERYLDVIVPRGGEALINTVVQHARMPVIKHSHGLCAIFVDRAADLAMAEAIVLNAKTQRPGVCNAAETLLLHREIAGSFLRRFAPGAAQAGLELRCDETAFGLLEVAGYSRLRRANRGRLGHGVPRVEARRPRGGRPRGRDRAHRNARLAPQRRHRYRR